MTCEGRTVWQDLENLQKDVTGPLRLTSRSQGD
jgi:hypothetical protein